MSDQDLTLRYNYEEFRVGQFDQWLRFGESPAIGSKAPDFPLQELDGAETSLSAIWKQKLYTVVEFGSFT